MDKLTAFNKLSSDLKAKIISHPTQTFLVGDRASTKKSYERLGQIYNLLDPNPAKRVPESFDGRKVWAGALTPVENQGGCGSCWAFASTSSLADRFNIQSRGLMHINLSQTKLILCDSSGKQLAIKHPEKRAYSKILAITESSTLEHSACFGNSLVNACRYLYEIGTPLEQCVPYNQILNLQVGNLQKVSTYKENSPAASQLPVCTAATGPIGDMCTGFSFDSDVGSELGEPARFYRCSHFYGLYGTSSVGGGEEQIRIEIWRWGPIITGIAIYPDFYTFDAKKDIYKWNKKGPQVGGHAIEIVGWGIEHGTKYWIIKNSWGEEWGDKGYFKMIRGINDCGIEENLVCMVPDFFYPTGYQTHHPRSLVQPSGKKVSGSDLKFADFNKPIRTKGGQNILWENRDRIANDIRSPGGGIDPTTGYTRRIMITMPWVNFERPVPLNELPSWKTFVAGLDSTPRKRSLVNNVKDTAPSVKYTFVKKLYTTVAIILVLAILGIGVIIVLHIIRKQ